MVEKNNEMTCAMNVCQISYDQRPLLYHRVNSFESQGNGLLKGHCTVYPNNTMHKVMFLEQHVEEVI